MSSAVAGFIALGFWIGVGLLLFRWWIPYEGLTQYVADKRRWRHGEAPMHRDGSQRGPLKVWRAFRADDDEEDEQRGAVVRLALSLF